jgi:hypothetical protein
MTTRQAWRTEINPPLIRFFDDDGHVWGFIFNHLNWSDYDARHGRLLLDWSIGTIVIKGASVEALYGELACDTVTDVRVDGQEITSITLVKRKD